MKILCVACQTSIKNQGLLNQPEDSSDDLEMQIPQRFINNMKVECPNCKDPEFTFREIGHKTMKSMLSNLKVSHRCTE